MSKVIAFQRSAAAGKPTQTIRRESAVIVPFEEALQRKERADLVETLLQSYQESIMEAVKDYQSDLRGSIDDFFQELALSRSE